MKQLEGMLIIADQLTVSLGKRKPRIVREVPYAPYTSRRLGNEGSSSGRRKQLSTTGAPFSRYRSETSARESRISGKRDSRGNNLCNEIPSRKVYSNIQVLFNKVNVQFLAPLWKIISACECFKYIHWIF